MTEHWKSQPKRFCDFCKCWIADNKASVDFHEKGKKHQENVKLRIDEVKKKGTERRQQKEQLNDDLAAIEAAALKAYKKDLGYTDVEKPQQPKPDRNHENKPVEEANEQSSSSAIENWSAYQTDEGYWYYYNNQTGETTWNPPQGFQSYDQSAENETDGDAKSNQQLPKDGEKPEGGSTPFGAWETVAVYESTTTNLEDNTDVKDNTEDVPAVKFKEKQLPTAKGTTNLSNDVSFKKRKGAQQKKRNIRQRTDDS